MNAGISFNRSASAADNCTASRWRLHHACVHADGRVVCPSCTQLVRVTPGPSMGGRVLSVTVNDHRGDRQ